jgi:hypothetical protein
MFLPIRPKAALGPHSYDTEFAIPLLANLDGASSDYAWKIALDPQNNAYIVGFTASDDFPTVNPFQTQRAGAFDAFVAKVSHDGTRLVYSTYLGGTGTDQGFGIAVDHERYAVITGNTFSTDFPLMNPLQPNHHGGYNDMFITKFNADGSLLEYSTYLGGDGNDFSYEIALDSETNAYVAGQTTSSDFPLVNPLQSRHAGNDAFVLKISPDGSQLLFSTYLGGSGYDDARGVS